MTLEKNLNVKIEKNREEKNIQKFCCILISILPLSNCSLLCNNIHFSTFTRLQHNSQKQIRNNVNIIDFCFQMSIAYHIFYIYSTLIY